MLVVDEKVMVHFNTNKIYIYHLSDGEVKLLHVEPVDFGSIPFTNVLMKKVDKFLAGFVKWAGVVNNERIRLYATGIFQKCTQQEQNNLVMQIYVDYGLYFNVVQSELEAFYLEKSMSVYGSLNMLEGLINQEFRRVVICGSFQQHLKEIGEIMKTLQKHNVTVLSPWTIEIVPETIGTDFILLKGQTPLKNKRDAWRHKYEHMEKFRQSDAIIVCNPDGVVGNGTMFEFGFMVAFNKRIIFIERPKDLVPFPYEVGLNFT